MGEKRICRKCGNPIGATTRINGVKKSLTNRKFCLVCSPWGKHNTKADDPSKPSVRRNLPYALWPDERKRCLQQSNYNRSIKRKEELVKMSGGKCIKCGYNRSIKALTFHHTRDKKFALDIATLAQKNWEAILEEWKKCELLCRNCHAEVH
jgi:hypothetical protein